MAVKKIFLSLLFLSNLGVILFYWFTTSADLLLESLPSAAIALGRLFGLLAAFGILLQFTLIGRSLWLERIFGLDKLAIVHHTSGKVAIILLILHSFLLTWGYSVFNRVGFVEQYFDFPRQYEHLFLAAVGFWIFLFVVGVSLYIVRAKLKYETWYFVHLAVYVAVALSFWHQIDNGAELLANRVFYYYWLALYIAVFGNHLIFRFFRPVYLYRKHKFFVGKIVRENYNVISIYINGENLSEFNGQAGQFMIMRFLDKNFWWQAHPFSISKMPDGKILRITPKQLGDYTKELDKLKPGTKVLVDGAYGRFIDEASSKPKILFIAGGIGITPIRALIEKIDKTKDTVLLYGNKTAKDIVFKEELESLSDVTGTKVVNVLSDEPNFVGETGYIDKEKIKKLVPDIGEREVFICGPPPMMTKVREYLRELGVVKKFIHFEKFSLQ